MEKIVFALPKGRLIKPCVELLKVAGYDFENMLNPDRALIFESKNGNAKALMVRAQDVPVYVENGSADVGVVGSDVLAEQEKELYEPLDLGFGKCRIVVAEPAELLRKDDPEKWTHIKIASKYPNITERHFAGRGVQIEVIKLYGSMELAPLVGLCERIVDLVSTGATLKANGLVEVEDIMAASARLVVNRVSLKTKHGAISKIIADAKEAITSLDLG